MHCSLYDVPADLVATIEVRSRLWNSTLAEDYGLGYVDEVQIYSKASVIVDRDVIQVCSLKQRKPIISLGMPFFITKRVQ